jgi:hypothetical protein
MNFRVIGMLAVMCGLAVMSACADDPAPIDPAEARCRFENPDGGCYTTRTGCVVFTVPPGPLCPSGSELIKISDDHCGDYREVYCPV